MQPQCRVRIHTPLVSVVLIFLNEERFLREAVTSILAQTYSHWELLLVDDGSTDGSSFIARDFSRRFPSKVRLLRHPWHANRGMSASRNLGLQQAKGEFILFMDADDVLTEDALKEQVALMEAYPEVGTVYGPTHWWYGWTGDPADQRRDVIQNVHIETDTKIEAPTVVPRFLLNEEATPKGDLFRTHLLREVGGFEEQFKGMYEDQVLRLKMCLRFPVYVSSRIWCKYRKHPDSCCYQAVQQGKVHQARGRFLSWAEEYCRQHDVHDTGVWKALRATLRPHRYPRLCMLEQQSIRYAKRMAWRAIETLKPIARGVLPKPVRQKIWDLINQRQDLRAS